MSPDGSTTQPPEERLLRLIRGKAPRPASDAPGPSRAGRAAAVAVGVAEIGARVREVRWPKLAIGVLSVILLMQVIGLVVQTLRPVPTITVPITVTTPPGESAQAQPAPPPLPSLAASAAHPIFTPPIMAAVTADAPKAGPSESAKELASRLTLMGLVAGEPGQAIIEDTQTKKTHFVTAGQAVVEGATLEEVRGSSVILDLAGEKIELTL